MPTASQWASCPSWQALTEHDRKKCHFQMIFFFSVAGKINQSVTLLVVYNMWIFA